MPAKLDDFVIANAGSLIRRAQQISTSLFLEECSEYNVTELQYAILLRAANRDGMDQTAMSETVGFDRTTTARVVRTLDDRGLLRRTTDPRNRKRKTLHITPAGRRLLSSIEAAVQRARDRIIAPLSPDEQEVFLRLLAKLVEGNNAFSRAPVKAERLMQDAQTVERDRAAVT